MGDVLDPPTRRAEREDVADARLVDHLLVEFAHATGLFADHEHAEESTVGDGAAGGDRQSLRTTAAGQRARVTVPRDTRTQLGELVGGEATRDEVERRLVDRPAQLTVRRCAADDAVPLVDVEHIESGRGDRLLRKHIQWIPRHLQLFDRARTHPRDGDRAADQIGAMLGIQNTLTDLADLVARATDPLQTAGHRRRCLDLDHQIDGTHVDAELE
ncbi:Uncharacterised protein [Mycobacteroides abscessus subsp. abscessus]|nr:Uncharacterised protein [Mycobacteroides abscessus subsp. abscessus]